MSVKRLTKAESVQFLRETAGSIPLPPGTKHAAIYITIDEKDGAVVTVARDEPIMESEPVRPAIIERAEDCTDYAGL